MYDLYRVMVIGEDGTEWCEGDHLTLGEANLRCESVEEVFENSTSFIEKEMQYVATYY